MAISDQVSPSSEEFKLTGSIGILVYSFLLLSALYSIKLGFKSKTSKRFFYVISLLCVMELPRYFGLAVQQDYTSTALYSLHILANSVFFISFSIVCYQWSGLLKLGTYFKLFYGIRGLVAANLTFTVIDIVAVAVCVLSSSLDKYFSSFFFEIFTFIEAVRNVVYSGFLTFYGLKLVLRFWHFSSMSSNRWVPAALATANENHQVFKQAVCRLTTVLVVTSVCFLLRMCMLAAKMAALYSHRVITTESFTLFGFWWFLFADFIPRVIPCIAFMQLMGTKKITSEQRRSLQTGEDYTKYALANNNETDEFQFVLLTGDEANYDNLGQRGVSSSGSGGRGGAGAGGSSSSLGVVSIIDGWKNMDADSLFGGDDIDEDEGDEEDAMNADGTRSGGVDDLYTIHLNLSGQKSKQQSSNQRVAISDTINL